MSLNHFLNPVRHVRLIIQEMWRRRQRVQQLEDDLLLLRTIIQRLVDEVRKLKEELAELRAWTQAEQVRISQRLELIERGLPAEPAVKPDRDDDWIM